MIGALTRKRKTRTRRKNKSKIRNKSKNKTQKGGHVQSCKNAQSFRDSSHRIKDEAEAAMVATLAATIGPDGEYIEADSGVILTSAIEKFKIAEDNLLQARKALTSLYDSGRCRLDDFGNYTDDFTDN